MAGPGGGPPRKSHTKSRKGCKTCKKRHIRCDEHFPQCRNCTKHNCRCDYQDSPPPSDDVPRSPKAPDVLWTAAIEAEIDAWLRTGIFPFPELGLTTFDQFRGLTKLDLRLVHHLASIYRDLQRKGLSFCVPWVEKLPLLFNIAAGYEFVMSAILAFSATHLAWISNSLETSNMAYSCRGTALQGLHGAIGQFSEQNCEPILAASILLSWQAADWGGWTSLMQGTSTVFSSMDGWKANSRLAFFVENNVLSQRNNFGQSAISSLNAPLLPEDDGSLQEAIFALQRLYKSLPLSSPLSASLERILQLAEDTIVFYATMPAQQLFEKLQEFRAHLLWTPITLMQSTENPNLVLIVVAHLYSVGLAIDASIPELNGAGLGTLTTDAIEEIERKLRFSQSPTIHQIYHAVGADDLMRFPREISYRARHRQSSPYQGPALASGQQSPYGFQNLHIESAPSTPGFPGTFPMFLNQSNEDLSVPPSPFLLQTYNASPTSRRHSQLLEQSPRPSTMPFGGRAVSGSSYRGESPLYSPAFPSPAHSFLEDDHTYSFGNSSSGYHTGFVNSAVWT